MKSYSFHEQLRKSREGVLLIALYLLNQDWVADIAVLDTDNEAQADGYDLVVTRNGGVKQFVEVKADAHDTGNVFFETMSNLDKGKEGCFVSSRADVWCYYLTALDRVLIFSLDAVRGEILKEGYGSRYREADVHTAGRGGGYEARGLIVPIEDVMATGYCAEVNDFRHKCQELIGE